MNSFRLVFLFLVACGIKGISADESGSEWISGIHWSAQTNKLRFGIKIVEMASTANPRIFLFFQNTSSNIIHFNLPSEDERFSFELKDEMGNPVIKTDKGQGMGKALDAFASFRSRPGSYVKDCFDPKYAGDYSIDELFKVTRPGRYVFTIQFRMFEDNGRKHFRHIYLPPLRLEFDLKKKP